MKLELSTTARTELAETLDYYESQQLGLGSQFLDEFEHTLDRIKTYPEGWTKIDAVFHRCLTRKFPYAIIYSIEGDVVQIAAVMNLHRKPGYWKN